MYLGCGVAFSTLFQFFATYTHDYLELLSSYVAQNNELQVRGSNVSIGGSSPVELQQPSDSRLYTSIDVMVT